MREVGGGMQKPLRSVVLHSVTSAPLNERLRMNRIMHCCSAALLIILVSACAQTDRVTIKQPAAANGGASAIVGTRVVLLGEDSCTAPGDRGIGGVLISLVSAVAPKLIDHGVDWFRELLEAKAEEFNMTTDSVTAGLFYVVNADGDDISVSPGYACLAIARGQLRTGPDSPGAAGYPDELGLSGRPHVYLEANFVYQLEGDFLYVRLEPSVFEFNQRIAPRGDVKDVVATFSFEFVQISGQTENSRTITLILPTFEDLTERTELSGPSISSLSSNWAPLPVPEPSAIGDGQDEIEGLMPVSLMATLSETDQGQGQQLFLRLTKVIEESKGAIVKALTPPR